MFEISIVLNFVVTIVLWSVLFSNKNESVFSPFFWYLVFHTLVFLIRPFYSLFFDLNNAFDYMQLNTTSELLSKTQLITVIGIVVFYFGYRASTKYMGNLKIKSIELDLSWKSIVYTWITLGSIATYSAIFTGSNTFSGNAFEMDRVDGVAINVGNNGYLLDAQYMLVGLIALLACKAKFRLWSLMPAVLFFIYRSFMGWGRWTIVLTCIALFLLWLNQESKKWPPFKIIIFILPMFVLFSVLGENRSALRDIFIPATAFAEYKSTDSRSFITKSLDSLDFANFDYLAYIVKNVPEKSNTYTYGVQYLQIFTEPVPRVLWKEKPAGAPIKLFSLNEFGNFEGLTTSTIGDAWISLGWLGVLIIMFAYGSVCGFLYKKFVESEKQMTSLWYLCIAALYIQFFRDGSLITIVKFSAFSLIPILFAFYINKFQGSHEV